MPGFPSARGTCGPAVVDRGAQHRLAFYPGRLLGIARPSPEFGPVNVQEVRRPIQSRGLDHSRLGPGQRGVGVMEPGRHARPGLGRGTDVPEGLSLGLLRFAQPVPG